MWVDAVKGPALARQAPAEHRYLEIRMQQVPSRVLSRDGTEIAYERFGDGSPVILVVGAFNDRTTGAPLAEFLAPDFTVFTYDRRGRGDSGDNAPYSVQREIEDLDALIGTAGGSAAVFGFSSGAVLALKAVAHGLAITRLVLYDAPFEVEGRRPEPRPDHAAQVAALVDAGRRDDAVEYFQTQVVGLPADMVSHAPFRATLEQMGHTLVYDLTVTAEGPVPIALAASVKVPALVIDGGDFGHPAMRGAAQALPSALQDGRHLSLDDQHHQIVPDTIGPPVRAFFAA
jgi:pimeloyl-ACP methyl ester carboxylesterase